MQRRRKYLSVILISIFLLSCQLTAKTLTEEGQDNKKERTWGSYLVSGSIEANHLFENIEGDRGLFRSQLNLKKGLNIGGISFRAYRDPEKKAFLDRMSLDVRGFGSEPYGRASFTLEKKELFSLSGGFTERKYFSDVASFANPLFNADSDDILFRSFHTWNTKEKSYDLSGRIKAFPWLNLNAFWQRTKMEGDSLITLRLLNNEFPLNEPLNQVNNVFRLGGEINIKNWLVYSLTGIYQKFELDQTTSTSESNIGIRGLPGGISSTYLSSQSRETKVDIEAWATDHSLQINPYSWLSIDGSYLSNRTRGHSTGNEDIEGRFIWPLYDIVSSATYLNQGRIKKDLDKADFAIHFQQSTQFRLNAGFDYHKYSIENTDSLDYSFTREYYNKTVIGNETSSPLLKLQQDRYFLDAGLAINTHFTAGAGYSRTIYKLGLSSHQAPDSYYTYKLNSYYGALKLSLTKAFSLKTTLEQGDYDNVFARLIPLETSSLKFEAQFNVANDIQGSFFYKHQKLENSSFSYSSSLNGYGGNMTAKFFSGHFGAVCHFSKNDFSSSMDIIRFVSMFREIEDISEYTSDVTYYSGGIWYRKGIFKLDAGYSLTKVDGTFPLKTRLPYLIASLRLFSNFAVNINYRYFYHDQNLFKSQSYKAHIYNIGFIFDF